MTPSTRLSGGHTPVMLRAVLDVLAPRDGGIYVDATFGGGGYSRAILEAADCRLYAIDRDPAAIARGQALAQVFGGRLTMLHGSFGDMDRLLDAAETPPADGIAFDLGVSSFQLDEAERGFSFRFDGPLDMRMDTTGGRTAAEVVATLSESELADVIFRYGEERRSRRVAKAIVAARTEAPITTTGRLAEVVRSALGQKTGGQKSGGKGIDPATRTFQALRIFVNDELGELRRGLQASERRLAPGGRLAVVSFHSLEDRMVKDFLRQRSGELPAPSRHLPVGGGETRAPSFDLMKRGAIKPETGEAESNPRARSARLRAATRTPAPAWPAETSGEGDVA